MRVIISLLILLPRLALCLVRVPQDVTTIQAGIDLAMEGDTVLISSGIWTEHLHIGSGRLTLCSGFMFSQDSLDIINTVIDGEFAGTIFSIDMDSLSSLELNGLTLTRGQGREDANGVVAGALNFLHAGSVYLSNLVFHNNRTSAYSSAINYTYIDWPSSGARFYLNNLNCYNNEGDNPQINPTWAIGIAHCKSLYAKKLRISEGEPTYSMQYYFIVDDSLVVADCEFKHLNHLLVAPMGLSSTNIQNQGGKIIVNDVNISENTFAMGGGFSCETSQGGYSKLHNIHFENNEFPNGGMYFDIRGNGEFYADSIFICGNNSRKSYALINSDIPGKIYNMYIMNNHMGCDEYFIPTWPGWESQLRDVSIDGAMYSGNTIERGLTNDGSYSSGGSLLYIQCEFADTLIYRNIRFINNCYIDHDNYSLEEMSHHDMADIEPNYGRMVRGVMGNSQPNYLLLDSCIFVGNIIENIIPEVNSTTWEYRMIGSNVDITVDNSDGSTLQASNIQMNNCDDGGITLVNRVGDVFVRNVNIVDTRRNGFSLAIGSSGNIGSSVSNMLISGIQQEESYTVDPFLNCFQTAINVENYGAVPIVFSNLTIAGNDVPLIFRSTGSGEISVKNSIVTNNVYSSFSYPLGSDLDFDHCLLSEAVQGDGNIWNQDPGFDSLLGFYTLLPSSPCVDAGDPTIIWNDVANPVNPVYALWPSLGGLRNDMGYTGGPHAALMDTSWAAMPTWEPCLQPCEFSLGAPWPNPFNPATNIALTLIRPGLAHLTVHNLLGQEVAVLHDGILPAGTFHFKWNASDQASGLYFVTLTVDLDKATTRAITLLR